MKIMQDKIMKMQLERKKARMLLSTKIQLSRHLAETQQVCTYLGETHSPLLCQVPSQVSCHALSHPPSQAPSHPPSRAPRKAPKQGLNLVQRRVPSKLQSLLQASWETEKLSTCCNHLPHQDQQMTHIRRASPSSNLKQQLLPSTQVSVLLLTKLQKELINLSRWS